MKKNNLKIVKIDKNKSLFNYEKKVLIKDLVLDLKLGYYDFEKEKPQKVKFTLEVNYEDKKPSNDKDLKSIVNYAKIVKLIKKLVKNKHYNFLETLAEDVFDELFKDRRIDKISLQIEIHWLTPSIEARVPAQVSLESNPDIFSILLSNKCYGSWVF